MLRLGGSEGREDEHELKMEHKREAEMKNKMEGILVAEPEWYYVSVCSQAAKGAAGRYR